MQFADPRTDFAFKLIFGNEKAKEEKLPSLFWSLYRVRIFVASLT
jgi:hypothetical protein